MLTTVIPSLRYYDPAYPLMNWFLSAVAGGDEPVPDATIIGSYGQGTGKGTLCQGLGCDYTVIHAVPNPVGKCTALSATNLLRFINGGAFARITGARHNS